MWNFSDFIYSPIFVPLLNGVLAMLVFKYFMGIGDMGELWKLGLVVAGVSFVSVIIQGQLGSMK